jgi:hypothetical protein
MFMDAWEFFNGFYGREDENSRKKYSHHFLTLWEASHSGDLRV